MKHRISIDPFLVKLFLAVSIASLLPARGIGAELFTWAANLAIALLFFLHGARLSREAIVAGAAHWRLHGTIFSLTFLVFPLVGLLLGPAISQWLTPELYTGVLFLCCLPATVQSAIAFTAIARGNVPAAICSASASSLLGVFLTPVLVGIVVSTGQLADVQISFDAVGNIMVQLLLPFVAGHLARPWIGSWVMKRNKTLKNVDQGSILLVVYTAFSKAIVAGLWATTPLWALVSLAAVCAGLLAIVLALAVLVGRATGFTLEDRITLLFCGSKKSLSSGIPIANILFAGHAVGAIILPLMLFHQIQLVVCAIIAGAYGRRSSAAHAGGEIQEARA